MSFTDPLSITIAGTTTPLPRVGDVDTSEDGSVYRSGDGLLTLTASHDYKKRTRRVLRIDAAKLTADPFKPAENVKVSMSAYTVFDLPPAGFAAPEVLAIYIGLNSIMTANSNAVLVKLLGGES